MKRIVLFSFILLAAAGLLLGAERSVAADTQIAAPKRVLVKVHDPEMIPAEFKDSILAERLGILELAVPAGWSTSAYLDYLQGFSSVSWAEADAVFDLQTITVNDPQSSSQTVLKQLNLPAAWRETQGSSTVKIGIIDTGIDGRHEDLVGRVIAGYDFVTEATIAAGVNSDENGHGTLMAGVIGATGNNGRGIAGLDWQAQLMPLKVADSAGGATAGRVASAITYAADHGIKVVNLSIGASTDFASVREAVTYASSKNVIIVAAAGNDGLNSKVLYPAAYPEVIAVGSVNSLDQVSSFSNTGAELDLVAPGEEILSTAAGGSHAGYKTATGTSMAAPHVTGAAGLLLARFPNLNRSAVQQMLEEQAANVAGMGGQDFTNQYGHGRLQPAATVSWHVEHVSQSAHSTLAPGQSRQFILYLRNVGQSTWKKGVANVGTDRSQDRLPGFIREDLIFNQPSGWLSPNRIGFLENSVPAGEVASFVFWYTVPSNKQPGVYREYFRPVVDGLAWFEDIGIYWDITVVSPAEAYKASFVAQNSHPSLLRGSSYQLQLQVKNTGSIPWRRDVVRLGTDRDRDRISPFIREDQVTNKPSGWISNNRVTMLEEVVNPGEIATFYFWYTVPINLPTGTYREYFSPVAENITWLDSMGIFWDITVQ